MPVQGVLQKLWVLVENRALVRVFDVGLEGHQALAARLVQQLVAEFQGRQVTFPRELGAFDRVDCGADDAFQKCVEDWR